MTAADFEQVVEDVSVDCYLAKSSILTSCQGIRCNECENLRNGGSEERA